MNPQTSNNVDSIAPRIVRNIHFVLSAATLTVIYFITIPKPYLYADDYYIRQLVANGELSWWNNLFTQMGRPLFGVFNRVVFSLGNDLSDYAWVRTFGLLGTLVCAYRLHQMGIRREWNGWLLTAVGFLVFANPGWAVFIGWTMCAAFPWAGWLALEAGDLALRAAENERTARARIRFGLASVILVLASIFIYQITVALALLPLLLTLKEQQRFTKRIQETLSVWSIVAFAYVGNFLFVKLVQVAVFTEATSNLNRDGLINDPLARLAELGSEVIPRLFAQWTAFLSVPAQVAGFFLLVAGIAAAIWSAKLQRFSLPNFWVSGVVLLGSLLLAAAPLLLLKENSFPWRILSGTSAVLFVGLAAILPARTHHPVEPKRRRPAIALLGLWALIQTGLGAYVFAEGFALPNIRETSRWMALLKSQLDSRPARLIYFEPPRQADALSRLPYNDEYGHGSASYVWIAPEAIRCYLDDAFPDAPKSYLHLTSIPEQYRPKESACIHFLDGRTIVAPGTNAPPLEILRTRTDGYFTEIQIHGKQWGTSWAGTFGWGYWPWIQHASLGWFHVTEEGSNSEIIYLVDQGNKREYALRPERPGEIYAVAEDRWMTYCEFLEEEAKR